MVERAASTSNQSGQLMFGEDSDKLARPVKTDASGKVLVGGDANDPVPAELKTFTALSASQISNVSSVKNLGQGTNVDGISGTLAIPAAAVAAQVQIEGDSVRYLCPSVAVNPTASVGNKADPGDTITFYGNEIAAARFLGSASTILNITFLV